MNTPPDSPLFTLLHQVRRRLWSGRILSQLLRATWWSAALLLGGGLVHAFHQPLPASAVAALAALPLAAAVLLGLLRGRPPLAHAAAIADRWFDGKALMSSALDQWQAPPGRHTRASRFVIEAADRCAPSWSERLAHAHRWRPPRHAVIPVALGLAGVYLLLLPGPAPRQDSVAIGATPPPADASRPNLTASDFVAGLRQALRDARQAPTDPAALGGGSALGGRQSATGRMVTLHTDSTQRTASADTRPGRARAVPQEGKTPVTPAGRGSTTTGSDGPRSDTAGSGAGRVAGTRHGSPAAPPLSVQYFPVVRATGDDEKPAATGHGAGRDLTPMPAALASVDIRQTAGAARWDTDMPDALTLSPAQRHYVRQYFSDLGEPR